jgi:hypothetical protein
MQVKGKDESLRIKNETDNIQTCVLNYKDDIVNAATTKRAYINDAGYLTNQYNTFLNFRVNNLFRSSSVILNIDREIPILI